MEIRRRRRLVRVEMAARVGALALVLCLGVMGFREVSPMAVKARKEWVTTEWTRPGVELYRQAGDFAELSGLIAHRSGRELLRAPGWSAQVNAATNFRASSNMASFFDAANERYVLVGTDGTDLISTYYSSAWAAGSNATLVSTMTDLGGLSGRNAVYFDSKLYVIGSDGDVYRDAYTGALGNFYGSGDAQVLATAGDQVYMASSAGVIYRLNSGDTAFEAYLTPTTTVDIRYLVGFRGYLLAVGELSDGTLAVYRVSLPSATQLQEVARVPGMGNWATYGCPFAVHDDKLYFLTGRYTNPDSTKSTDVWEFNGSQARRVARVTDTDMGYTVVGLFSWKHLLILYGFESTAAAGNHTLWALVGDEFVEYNQLTWLTPPVLYYHITGLGPELVVVMHSASNYGVKHAGATTLQDGYLVTSAFDGGSPYREKKLWSLTVLLDGKTTDFKIPVKYRVNDETSWTLATTGDGSSRRVNIGFTGVSFYTLQLRVDLDDDSGSNKDHRILAVSAVYSMEE